MSTFYYILRDLLLEQGNLNKSTNINTNANLIDSFTLIYDKQLGLDGLKR